MSYNNYPQTDWRNRINITEPETVEDNDTDDDEKLIIYFSNQQEEYGDWCSLTLTFSITTKILDGEGPIAIANRVNQLYQEQLNSNPEYSGLELDFDWYDVVIQNYEYFDGIIDQDNRDNPDYWTNSKTKAGDIITLDKHTSLFRLCQYEYQSAGDLAEEKGKEIDMGNGESAHFYVKGSAYGKASLGLTLGVDTEFAKALIDISLVGKIESNFLIDNDPETPTFSDLKSSLDLKFKAVAQGKIGKLNTGVEVNAKYDILNDETECDVSAYYQWGDAKSKKKESMDGKRKFSADLGFNLTFRKFKYESANDRTTISFNIKAFGKIKQTFRLHPLIKLYISLEAGADADFVLVLPGNFEPEYIEESEIIDFGKTIDKVNLMLPESDTLYPNQDNYSIPKPVMK